MLEKDPTNWSDDSYLLYGLRQDAMDCYEQCLLEQKTQPLEAFIQRQLLYNPFHLELLYELTNDIQQRFVSLKEHQFDARKRVIQALTTIYETDISHLAPADKIHHYHHLSPKAVIECVRLQSPVLTKEEEAILTQLVTASTQTSAQLAHDIKLTFRLLKLLADWLSAATLTSMRQTQASMWSHQVDELSRVQ
jgi:hypothetical protein